MGFKKPIYNGLGVPPCTIVIILITSLHPPRIFTWRKTTHLSMNGLFFHAIISHMYMGMDQYLLIPFLGGWTSIYQLFWGSLGTRVLTHPHMLYYQRILLLLSFFRLMFSEMPPGASGNWSSEAWTGQTVDFATGGPKSCTNSWYSHHIPGNNNNNNIYILIGAEISIVCFFPMKYSHHMNFSRYSHHVSARVP